MVHPVSTSLGIIFIHFFGSSLLNLLGFIMANLLFLGRLVPFCQLLYRGLDLFGIFCGHRSFVGNHPLNSLVFPPVVPKIGSLVNWFSEVCFTLLFARLGFVGGQVVFSRFISLRGISQSGFMGIIL